MRYSGTNPEAYITESTLVLSRARWGLGFGVWGMGFGVWGLGFGVRGLGYGVGSIRHGVWDVGGEHTWDGVSPSEMRNLLAEAGDSI